MISQPSHSGETPRKPGYFRKQLIKLLATTSLMTACEEDDKDPLPPIQQTTSPDHTTLPNTTDDSEDSEGETMEGTSEGTEGSTDSEGMEDVSTSGTTGEETDTTEKPEMTTGDNTTETTGEIDTIPPSAPVIMTNDGEPLAVVAGSFPIEGKCDPTTRIMEYNVDGGKWIAMVSYEPTSSQWKIEANIEEVDGTPHLFCFRSKKSKSGNSSEEDCIQVERVA